MNKEFLINLQKKNSVIALITSSVVFVATFSVIIWGVVDTNPSGNAMRGLEFFRYFTVLSNLFLAFTSSQIIPCSVDGIRHKLLVIPKWTSILLLTSAINSFVVIFVTIFFLVPILGIDQIEGIYFWLHIINPFCALCLVLVNESRFIVKFKHAVFCQIPFLTYTVFYLILVNRGIWRDFYGIATRMPIPVTIIVAFFCIVIVSFLYMQLHNFVVRRRQKKLSDRIMQNVAEMEDIELGIECYGLGRYYGKNIREEIYIPLDIIEDIQKGSKSASGKKLVKAALKGAYDGHFYEG